MVLITVKLIYTYIFIYHAHARRKLSCTDLSAALFSMAVPITAVRPERSLFVTIGEG